MCISIVFLFWIFIQNVFWSTIIILPPFTFLAWFSFYREKTSYRIYSDRLEFFNENNPNKVDVINNEDIEQVRYEDEFGDSAPANTPKAWLIYVYLKDNHSNIKFKNIKENRICPKPSQSEPATLMPQPLESSNKIKCNYIVLFIITRPYVAIRCLCRSFRAMKNIPYIANVMEIGTKMLY